MRAAGPGQAAGSDADPALEHCIERPFELTFATERHELVEIDALPLQPCEPRPASAEG